MTSQLVIKSVFYLLIPLVGYLIGRWLMLSSFFGGFGQKKKTKEYQFKPGEEPLFPPPPSPVQEGEGKEPEKQESK